MKKYTIGIDFGSLSARALLMDIETGDTVDVEVYEYPHGIINERLPTGYPVPDNYALQDASDYYGALMATIPQLLRKASISPDRIIGIGLDSTSTTLLPVNEDGIPLSADISFLNNPHAYVKLWKHHGAIEFADRLEDVAKKANAPWLNTFGGKISSEHYYPKALEIAAKAPEVYSSSARVPEIGDWLVWMLTGKESRGYTAAAFKTYFSEEVGEISETLLSEVVPDAVNLQKKLSNNVLYPGDCAGLLTEKAAEDLGLIPGIPVSSASVDAHATVYGCHLSNPGDLVLILGTSTCIMAISDKYREIPGLLGVVSNGILPNLYAYEGGQSCVGDMFAWFAENAVPSSYKKAAQKQNKSILQFLTEAAERIAPGESGLLALDWWNGVRSTLLDFDLSGSIYGLTINTRPEHIFRTLIESTAFGAKRIIDTIEQSGVCIKRVFASGGIPVKNPLLSQIYSDVLNRELIVVNEKNSGALGSAILGYAASSPSLGFQSLSKLTEKYYREPYKIYYPNPSSFSVYASLYELYSMLYDSLGDGRLLKDLKRLSIQSKQQKAEKI